MATVRAVTWNTVGSSSPAILNMFGIISSRPCDAVNVRAHRAGLQHAVDRADRAAFALHFHDAGDGAPEILFAFRRPLVAPLGDG